MLSSPPKKKLTQPNKYQLKYSLKQLRKITFFPLVKCTTEALWHKLMSNCLVFLPNIILDIGITHFC